MADRHQSVLNHYQSFFQGHNQELFTWEIGPIKKVVPAFRVFRAEPGPKIDLWSYASIGASGIWHENAGLFEFIIHSPIESPRLVEILAMITHYHGSYNLGFGHTLPIGEPWLGESQCDHCLVSKPYPLGPELEICCMSDAHIHVAWLLPITEAEMEFKAQNGLEALEQKFDDEELAYWNVDRSSVV